MGATGVLFGDGIVLRPITPGDAADLLDAVRASRSHLTPWMAWASEDYGPDDVQVFLDAVAAGRELAFGIRDATGGRLCGVCGLNRLDPANQTANLGYWVRADEVGRGRATAASRLLLAYGLVQLGLERIEVLASVHNTASVRVAERLGIADEGVRRRALAIAGEQHDARVFAAFHEHLEQLMR